MRIMYHTGQMRIMGGIERVLSMKLNYLADKTEHNVFLVTYEQGDNPYIFPLSDQIRKKDIGINYNVDYTRKSLYSWKYLRKIPTHIKKLKTCIQEIVPDVIVIPNFGFEFYFLPYISGNIPIVREFHDSQYLRHRQPRSLLKRIKYYFDQSIEKKYDRIALLTQDECSYFQNRTNIVVIPNPIDTSSSRIACDRNNIVITAGRLSPVKAFDTLIEIWNCLDDKLKQTWNLHIYGDGETCYVDYLRRMIDERNLTGKIILKGNSKNIYQKFQEASLFVCTSKTESFGMAIVEAESCGLPIISFDCPNGPRNIIQNGNDGFLISNFSRIDFLDKLTYLLSNPSTRHLMGKKAIENSRRYSIDKIMQKWINNFNMIRQ